jgi:hypothetical protein
VISQIDPEKYGYVKLEGYFENGLYGGQKANPAVIAKSLNDIGITRFVFKITYVGQFDMKFVCYVHESQKVEDEAWERLDKDGEDHAEIMKRALKGI